LADRNEKVKLKKLKVSMKKVLQEEV